MSGRPLTLPPDELRRLGHRVVDAIVDHWTELPGRPPLQRGDADDLRARLGGPPPDAPGDPDAALDRLLADVVPNMQHGDHPRFFARVPGPSNPVGALADALAAGFNVIAASWPGSTGPATLELIVLDWLRAWCGLPEETEGILVSGGSIGSLTALAAARTAGPPDGIAYLSDQTHASVVRALRILGFGPEHIRVLDSDDALRLDARAVAGAVARDRAAGGAPAIVVATAGTTNTGAVDPLAGLADLCAAEGLWLHVDGAYGAPAVLAERGRTALAGMERADSLVLDPHKWLFQPYEAGCALVRRPGALAAAFAMFPEYLRDVGGEEVHFRDRGPQLTRGSRALKLWLTLQVFGLDAVRAAVARGIELAEVAQQAIEAAPELDVVSPAQLGIVTFGAGDVDVDRLAERMIADGFAVLGTTVLRRRTVLRLCTINPRTTDDDIRRTVGRVAGLAAGQARIRDDAGS